MLNERPKDRTPQEVWTEACKKAAEYVDYVDFEDAGDAAIEAAHDLLAIAHQLKGVACCACSGLGKFTYVDVCDRCWGTGRADKTGPDMNRITLIEKQNDHLHLRIKSLVSELAHLRAMQEKSWGAADEALAAERDCEMSRVTLVLGQFCHQCAEGNDPGACPDCLLRSLGGGKEKDSTRLTDDPVNSGSCNDGELGEKCDQG